MFVIQRSILLFFTSLFTVQLQGQAANEVLRKFTGSPVINQLDLQYVNEVKDYYSLNNYQYVWLTDPGKKNIVILTSLVSNASQLGLLADDYQPKLFSAVAANKQLAANEQDSIAKEIKFTDAAIHFIHDMLMGNKPPQLAYQGLTVPDTCFNIPAILNSYIVHNRFALMAGELEYKQPEYLAVKALLNHFQKITSPENFKDVQVTKSNTDSTNKPLVTRLYQLGYLSGDSALVSDSIIIENIKETQNLFSLLDDGRLRSTTKAEMNVPFSTRIAELTLTLNSLRWLYCIKQTRHIVVVNIPSATLLVYEHGKVVLESRIIVGKKSTPTPTLSSTITEVILYPYWNVPYKIATRELLPKIKRSRNYLDANNYQVLNSNGKVVDPTTINWRALSTKYFPYTIRQSTGCDNALGLIKLNFYNPFTVYLHDTPGKNLFSLNKRYFSHGCMRTEKAMELGRYILQGNSIAIDTLTEKGCLYNQSPITVPATEKIPVFVLYHTAWMDAANKVRFYEDVYNKRN